MRKVRNLRILTFLTFLSAFSKKEPTFDVGVIDEETISYGYATTTDNTDSKRLYAKSLWGMVIVE